MGFLLDRLSPKTSFRFFFFEFSAVAAMALWERPAILNKNKKQL
jgi:hypothetical protein